MLCELHIKNIALIDDVTVRFHSGFNVLTGETGAGKSILIDAIGILLGERTSKSMIRSGQSSAFVEASFSTENLTLKSFILEIGFEYKDELLILSRQFNMDGKNFCRINGRIVSLSSLKEIGKLLVNIHGQNDSQVLLSPSFHINFLDRFGKLEKLLKNYQSHYDEFLTLDDEIAKLSSDKELRTNQSEILKFQVAEIEAAELIDGEEEILKQRLHALINGEKILNTLNNFNEKLYSGEASVYDILCEMVREFTKMLRYDSNLDKYCVALNNIISEIDDVAKETRQYANDINFSSNELEQIEERLWLIGELKRKYGQNINEIIDRCSELKAKLSFAFEKDEKLVDLIEKLRREEVQLKRLGEELSKKRKLAAIELEQQIMVELVDLDVKKVNFKVDFFDDEKRVKYTKNGHDKVEFLISTNVGEPLKPLSKVASGGETSRIMLAIKSILSQHDCAGTLVLDEIDTGVSGRTAQKIGEKLKKISHKRQILVITHLAQIASTADCHYLVAKRIKNGTSSVNVKCLSDKERKHELARIMGGLVITEANLMSAEEMLKKSGIQ